MLERETQAVEFLGMAAMHVQRDLLAHIKIDADVLVRETARVRCEQRHRQRAERERVVGQAVGLAHHIGRAHKTWLAPLDVVQHFESRKFGVKIGHPGACRRVP